MSLKPTLNSPQKLITMKPRSGKGVSLPLISIFVATSVLFLSLLASEASAQTFDPPGNVTIDSSAVLS